MKCRLSRIYKITLFIVVLIFVIFVIVGCQKPKISSKSSKRNKSDRPPQRITSISSWEENTNIKSALDQGNYKKAQRLAERTIRKQPANHEAYYFLAKALEAQNKTEQALQYYERAITLAPENIAYKKDFTNALFSVAKTANSQKNYTKSIQFCKKALSIYPDSDITKELLLSNFIEVIKKYKMQKNQNELESFLKEAINTLPHQNLQLELAILYIDQDRVLEAENILKKIYHDNPNFVENNYWYAKLLYKLGDIKKAKEIVEKSLELDPNSIYLLELKNELDKLKPLQTITNATTDQVEKFPESETEFINKLYQLENEYNYAEILKLLTNYVKKNPNKDWVYLKLATTYERIGDYQNMYAYTEKYLHKNPSDSRGTFCKARALHQLGKLDESLKLLHNLLSKISNNIQIYDELGQVYAKKGDFKKAKDYWNKALEISPDYANIYFNFAQLAMEQGNYSNAEEMFKKALDLEPFNAKFYFFAGLNYKSQGKEKEALEIWNSTLNWLNPQDPYANRILKALGKTLSANTSSQIILNISSNTDLSKLPNSQSPIILQQSQPINQIDNIDNNKQEHLQISQSNENVDSEYLQAIQEAKSGNFKKALQGLNSYLQKKPDDVNAIINRGKVYTAMQMPPQAIVNYIQALKISPNNQHALELLVAELKELGMHKFASEYVQKLISLNPTSASKFPDYISSNQSQLKNNPRAYEPVVKELLRNNLTEEAKMLAFTARDENPENINFMLLEADVRYITKEYDKAETILKSAIAQEPAEPMPYIKLGDLYYTKNLLDQAYQQYQLAQKCKYFNPDIGLDLVERYRALKKYKEANLLINQIKGMNLSNTQYERLQNLLSNM